ncbi:SRPBCC family protein [Demequina sp. NBRC 110056]|uniref:SRPBCC family protein n=1 Tax=Demequina sp. NBRC 110056 TaxID=1570345 RepID=UPI000A0352EC|nr:SRPBCC family protein [Demequina sp. NBRC 110056]
MIEVGSVIHTSTAPPEAFFERWVDLPTHPEWASSMEWFDVETPVALGSRGTAKSVGNDPAPFEVTALEAPHVYSDTTVVAEDIDGNATTLTVHHEARPLENGSRVEIRAWLDGPQGRELEMEMRAVLERALPQDLAALVALVEGRDVAEGEPHRLDPNRAGPSAHRPPNPEIPDPGADPTNG